MPINPTRASDEAEGVRATPPAGPVASITRRRRPWWVWLTPFALMAGVLFAVNASVLGTPLYERSDQAANSILIEQARRFTLLTGIYSRTGIDHPGPAYLYPRAWTEQLFWAATRLVPTAFNGQLIAVYVMSGLFAAFVVVIAYGWTERVRGALACLAVVFIFAYLHPPIFSSDWLSYSYVPTYFAFLIAVASVAAGRLQDVWIMVVTGWFLIEGHVAFLLFVPVLSLVALAGLAWPRRHRLGAALRSFVGGHRRIWGPALAISAVFALPMIVNLILHWPGYWGKYLTLSGEHGGGSAPTLRQVVAYALWFWRPLRHTLVPVHYSWLIPVVAYLVAGVATATLARGPVRRFLTALLVVNTVSSALLLVFVDKGIDQVAPGNHYICYFYWSAPAIMLLVVALAVAEALPSAVSVLLAAAVATAACVAFALAPAANTVNVDDSAFEPALPHAVSVLAARSSGKPIVIRLGHGTWSEMVGFLVQAERSNVRACLADPAWKYMVTSQFICTPEQVAHGATYTFLVAAKAPAGTPVLERLGGVIVTDSTGTAPGPTG
ncbi:MAG TPA: hypothetical protein VI365_30270 [Trebonia sp.]